MFDFIFTIQKLFDVAQVFGVAFVISFLLTPFIGKIAKMLKAVDMPALKRRRDDPTIATRIHNQATPRLGGLAVYIPFMILMFMTQGFTNLTIGIGIGLTILTLGGVIDDIKDLPGYVQILFQFAAVFCLILVGVRILDISVMGIYLNFDSFRYTFELFGFSPLFVFPADIITIFWFLVIINAMNWVSGIDALEETMSVIAGFTLMLLSIKFGNDQIFLLSTIFTGSILGFTFFNFPPAFIFSGTVGNALMGYLLALLAIKIDGKMTTSILLLALPLVDFIWVLMYRLYKFKQFNPLKLMSISGKHHLHHRLMRIGYTSKQVLLIEVSIFCIFAIFAYYLAGFNIFAIAMLGSIVFFFLLFSLLLVHRKNLEKKEKEGKVVLKGKRNGDKIEKSPEELYAY